MKDEFSQSELERFLAKALEAEMLDQSKSLTEDDLKQIALRAGLSESDWKGLCCRLDECAAKGRNFLKFGNASDAVEALDEAVTIAPYRADLLADCGEAHRLNWSDNGDEVCRDIAVARFEKALRLDAGNETAAEGLSKIRQETTDRSENSSRKRRRILIVSSIAAALGITFSFIDFRTEDVALPGKAPAATDRQLPVGSGESGDGVASVGDIAPVDAAVLGDRSFKVFREDIPWHEAKQRCEAMGGRLAIVKDSETRNFLQQLKGGQRLWLGATDEHSEGDWRWLDGSAVESDGWADNQPFNLMGLEHYMEIGPKGTFNDVGVRGPTEKFRINGFICEWPAVEQKVQSLQRQLSSN